MFNNECTCKFGAVWTWYARLDESCCLSTLSVQIYLYYMYMFTFWNYIESCFIKAIQHQNRMVPVFHFFGERGKWYQKCKFTSSVRGVRGPSCCRYYTPWSGWQCNRNGKNSMEFLKPPSWMLQIHTHMSHFTIRSSDYWWDSAKWNDHSQCVKRVTHFVVQSWWFHFLLLSCPVISLHFLWLPVLSIHILFISVHCVLLPLVSRHFLSFPLIIFCFLSSYFFPLVAFDSGCTTIKEICKRQQVIIQIIRFFCKFY